MIDEEIENGEYGQKASDTWKQTKTRTCSTQKREQLKQQNIDLNKYIYNYKNNKK